MDCMDHQGSCYIKRTLIIATEWMKQFLFKQCSRISLKEEEKFADQKKKEKMVGRDRRKLL